MEQFLIIDDNNAFANALNRFLSMRSFQATIADLSQITNEEWQILKDKDIILINANLKLEDKDKRTDDIGVRLARRIKYDERIDVETPIIITSVEPKHVLGKRANFSLSEQDGFYFLDIPISIIKLEEILKRAKKTSISLERKRQELRKLNLEKAIEVIRTANHNSQNASMLVKRGFKTLFNNPEKDGIELLDQLIAYVRRDKGGWIKWFKDELTLFPGKLQELGFNCKEEFPGEMMIVDNSMERIQEYLALFHVEEDISKITQNDKYCMVRQAEYVYNEFEEIGGSLQQIRTHLEGEK